MLSSYKNRAQILLFTSIFIVGLIAGVALPFSLSSSSGIGMGWLGFNREIDTRPSPTYAHNWDDNPNAYIPEAEAIGNNKKYAHNWDDNPNAYIPEAEIIGNNKEYAHNWDNNPNAYIPEAEALERP